MKETCPECGSIKIYSTEVMRTFKFPFIKDKTIELVKNECEDCGTDGDFFNKNTDRINKMQKLANAESAKENIEYLKKECGWSQANIERVFHIPQRTMHRWKSGDVSATVAAFLRIIRAFPEIISIADGGWKIPHQKK